MCRVNHRFLLFASLETDISFLRTLTELNTLICKTAGTLMVSMTKDRIPERSLTKPLTGNLMKTMTNELRL
jgi:hypothetical protein